MEASRRNGCCEGMYLVEEDAVRQGDAAGARVGRVAERRRQLGTPARHKVGRKQVARHDQGAQLMTWTTHRHVA